MSDSSLVPTERIDRAILMLGGQKVILDADLAILYGVTTKALNQAVKRNENRFPSDFGGFFLRFAACIHRARGAYVDQRAQFRASRPGEGPGRARIHSAPGGYGRSRRSRAKTGGDGEEVRHPIQNGLRDDPPAKS